MFVSVPVQQPPKPIVVTIWVHGTKPGALSPKVFRPLVDSIGRFLFLKEGLHKASLLDEKYYLQMLARKLCSNNQDLFDFCHMYFFGWSGKLSRAGRKRASEKLFLELVCISQVYQRVFNCKPLFNIVTHSHGGNVALHLAEVAPEGQTDVRIEKLILLGCPIQKHTSQLIHSSLFVRIYNIYSHTDTIQIIDPQGLHGLFAQRSDRSLKTMLKELFKPLLSERHFTPSEKVAQIAVAWKNGIVWMDDYQGVDLMYLRGIKRVLKSIDLLKSNRGLIHIEFNLLPFVSKLAEIILSVDQGTLVGSASQAKEQSADYSVFL